MDGVETALLLITENEGTITPYGVVYDNGMELSLIYQGRNFPEYLYEEGLMTVSLQSIHASDDSSEAVWLYLPAPERQIARMLCRGGLESEEFAKLEIQINNLPAVVETACALERESVFAPNPCSSLRRGAPTRNESSTRFPAVFKRGLLTKAKGCLTDDADAAIYAKSLTVQHQVIIAPVAPVLSRVGLN